MFTRKKKKKEAEEEEDKKFKIFCMPYLYKLKCMDIICMKSRAAEKVKFLSQEKFQHFHAGFIFE